MNVKATVVLLYASDMSRSRAFYCDSLGFHVEQSWAPEGEVAWCWLSLEGAALMLQQAEPGDTTGPSRDYSVYFLCENVDELYEKFRAQGIDVNPPETAFYGMKQLFVSDPDGRTLCFEQNVTP